MAKSNTNDSEAIRRKFLAIGEIVDKQERTFFDLKRQLVEVVLGDLRSMPSAELNALLARLTAFVHTQLPVPSSLTEDMGMIRERLGDTWQTEMEDAYVRLFELEQVARQLNLSGSASYLC